MKQKRKVNKNGYDLIEKRLTEEALKKSNCLKR